MVKPHAVKESLEITIERILCEKTDRYMRYMHLNKRDIDNLKRVQIVKTFYRPLEIKDYQQIFEVFYKEDIGTKYYSAMKKEYCKDLACFFLIKSDLEQEELLETIKEIKGWEQINDFSSQKIYREGKGIRGILRLPVPKISMENPTPEQIKMIISNVIHTPDKTEESIEAIKILLSLEEISSIEQTFPSFKNFLHN